MVSPRHLYRILDKFGDRFDVKVKEVLDAEAKQLEAGNPICQAVSISATSSGQKIIIDNLYYRQEVHYMSQEHQTVDNHFLSVCATKNRVAGNPLSSITPTCALKRLDVAKCIPNAMDQANQRFNYIIFAEKMLVKHLPSLKLFQDFILRQIPHLYSETMSKASETVNSLCFFF